MQGLGIGTDDAGSDRVEHLGEVVRGRHVPAEDYFEPAFGLDLERLVLTGPGEDVLGLVDGGVKGTEDLGVGHLASSWRRRVDRRRGRTSEKAQEDRNYAWQADYLSKASSR